jgi:hypothetical protein
LGSDCGTMTTADYFWGRHMTRRRLSWLAVLLVIEVLALLLTPAARMRLVAALRGEAFYCGTPSSQWSKVIREGPIPYSPPGTLVRTDFNAREPATSMDRVKKFLGLPHIDAAQRFPLRIDDPNTIPVLIDLLEDEHSSVRMYAAETLGAFGSRAKRALPALRKRVNDKEYGGFAISVGERATEAIAQIESNEME